MNSSVKYVRMFGLRFGASDAIHKRILNLGECSNTNMDIDSYRENNFPTEHSIELPEDQLSDKSHGPTIFGR